jgi:hypothetical protein
VSLLAGKEHLLLEEGGRRRVTPFLLYTFLPDIHHMVLHTRLGAKGNNFVVYKIGGDNEMHIDEYRRFES